MRTLIVIRPQSLAWWAQETRKRDECLVSFSKRA